MQPCDSILAGRQTQAGLSRHSARVYSRPGCHLCDDAVALLMKQGYVVDMINIDEDAALRERFHECVPVVEIRGRIRFRGRVNEVLLRRMAHGDS